MPDRPLSRVLVVEDDPDTANLVALALSDVAGYVVKSCASARDGLAAARSFRPDLILLDVMMPGQDGVSALKSLREQPATRKTPVVFMTAMAQPESLARHGCVGVIPKPFDPLKLAETLEAFWGRRRGDARRKACLSEFDELRRVYVEELPGRIAALQNGAQALAAGGWERATLEGLYHETHRLAGSAGLYRMANLSCAAATLEEIVKALLAGATWPPASPPGALVTLVKAVARTARTETRMEPPPQRES
jgi:CheY-like chemotaxis protein